MTASTGLESDEPAITINGRILTVADAMTVRVAIEDFALSLKAWNALGADETGRAIRAGYLTAIDRLRGYMGYA